MGLRQEHHGVRERCIAERVHLPGAPDGEAIEPGFIDVIGEMHFVLFATPALIGHVQAGPTGH
ncbi:Uncharacterised protein [Mycobacteroides abscessus subsp. abscessus]|nr:Uncharacterised protein [Mycobacteroides abscessus subsp. abscessus]